MKEFIKRNPLPVGIAVFILVSLFLALASYEVANLSYSQKNILKSLPWSMEPTEKYTWIYARDTPGQFEASDGEKWYLIDAEGRVFKEIPEDESLGEGLYDFEKNGLYGVRDAQGRTVIAAKYRSIDQFHHGYTAVWDGVSYKLLDRKGSQVFSEKFVTGITHIKGKKYYIQSNHDYVLDPASGEKTYLPSKVKGIYADEKGNYIAELAGDTFCYLTDSFRIPEGAVLYRKISEFAEGLAYIERYDDLIVDEKRNVPLTRGHTATRGYMNEAHKIVLPLSYDDIKKACPFSEGKALIYADKKVICIDGKGKTLFTLDDHNVSDRYDCLFSGGYAVLTLDGKNEGVINEKGKFVIEPVFDSVGRINAGYVAVDFKGKYGIINLKEAD